MNKLTIVKYPNDILLNAIAKHHGKNVDEIRNGLTNIISAAHYHSDFFCTLMQNNKDEVIGCANFIQSSSDPFKWFYTDLWVVSEYRRQGCATEIIRIGRQYLSELHAKTLLCTVEPHNEGSLKLQRSLGFEQIETQPFEDFETDGLIMFRINIPTNFNMVTLIDDFNYLMFICDLLTHPFNVSALHLKKIADDEYPHFFKEMREALVLGTPKDELNYIIRKGIVPIGWLKLKKLDDTSLRIRMLLVHEKYRNLGVGRFALNFVEKFAHTIQCKHIYASITADNVIAQSLYEKAGYTVLKEENYRNEEGSELVGLTFYKEISHNPT